MEKSDDKKLIEIVKEVGDIRQQMKSQHTPTPWEVTPTLGKLAITRPHKTVGIAFDCICHMDSSRRETIDPEANAAFIVCAVNNYEELLSIVKELDVAIKRGGDLQLGVKGRNATLAERVKQAISTAEGKS